MGIELYKSLNCNVPIHLSHLHIMMKKTFLRAIETNPLGYLIKPHKEDDLKALLKLSYYKLQTNKEKVAKYIFRYLIFRCRLLF